MPDELSLDKIREVRKNFPEHPDTIIIHPDVWEQLEKKIDKANMIPQCSTVITVHGMKVLVDQWHPEKLVSFWANGKLIYLISIVEGKDKEDVDQT